MDQKSLQALLQELQGLDEVSPPTGTADSSAGATEQTSDYSAWYEDYVKSTPAAAGPAESASLELPATASPPNQVVAPQDNPVDLRKLTYAQALPVLSKLARDESFLDALQEVNTRLPSNIPLQRQEP